MKTSLDILGIVLLALFTISMSECDPEGGSTGGTGGTVPVTEPTTPKDKLVGTYDCVLYLRKLGEGNEISQLHPSGTLQLSSSGVWMLNLKGRSPISWSGASWDADTTDLTLRTADGFYQIPYEYGDACQKHPLLRHFAIEGVFVIKNCSLLLIFNRGYIGFNRK